MKARNPVRAERWTRKSDATKVLILGVVNPMGAQTPPYVVIESEDETPDGRVTTVRLDRFHEDYEYAWGE